MAINLADYMSAHPSDTTTQALQACVKLRKPVFIPPTTGWRSITRPILCADLLYIYGEQQNQIAYKDEFDAWQSVEYSNLLFNEVTKGRPAFIWGKYILGNFIGWYWSRVDKLYRMVYQGATPSGADTDWASDYTTDPIADLYYLDTIIGGQPIVMKEMTIYNADSYSSILAAHTCYQCVFHDCNFYFTGSGLNLNGFQTSVQRCNFFSNAPSWPWLDTAVWNRIKAGTASPSDLALKAVQDQRLIDSCGLYAGGNTLMLGNRLVCPYGTSLQVNGNGCFATGTYIERSYHGLIMGGLPFQDINSLANQLTIPTNKLVSGLPTAVGVAPNIRAFVTDSSVAYTPGLGTIVAGGGTHTALVYSDGANWRIGNLNPHQHGTTGGEINGLEMESNYGHIWFKNCSTPFKNVTAIGHNAIGPDGTDLSSVPPQGQPMYGILRSHMTKEYSNINIGGDINIQSISDSVQPPIEFNEVDTIRDQLAAIVSDVNTLDSDKASVESVEILDNRVTQVEEASANATDLDALAAIVSDLYSPPS